METKDETGFINTDGMGELHNEVGGNITDAYVIRLLTKQECPITPETIELKRQSLLMRRFRKKVLEVLKEKKRLN